MKKYENTKRRARKRNKTLFCLWQPRCFCAEERYKQSKILSLQKMRYGVGMMRSIFDEIRSKKSIRKAMTKRTRKDALELIVGHTRQRYCLSCGRHVSNSSLFCSKCAGNHNIPQNKRKKKKDEWFRRLGL